MNKNHYLTITARLMPFSLVSLITACGVIRSDLAKDNSSGLVYSLPKGQVQINVERKLVTTADVTAAQKSAADAKSVADASAKAISDAKTELSDAKDLLKAAQSQNPVDTTLIAQCNLAINKAQAKLDNAKSKSTKAISDADEAQKKARAEALSAGSMQEIATLTLLPVAPDPDYRYTANLVHYETRDDNLKLTVSNGMLSSSDISTVDRTGDILTQLATTVATFLPMPKPSITQQSVVTTTDDSVTLSPFSYTNIFDPTDQKAINQINQDIMKKEGSGKCPKNDNFIFLKSSYKCGHQNSVSSDNDGLFYRATTTVIVQVCVNEKSKNLFNMKTIPSAQALVAVVPDSHSTYRLPSIAGAFTTTTQNFVFANGTPVSYSVVRPSEILAVFGIPVSVAKSIISVPTQMLQLRISQDSAATAKIQAQVDQLKAQTSLIQQQATLKAAESSAH